MTTMTTPHNVTLPDRGRLLEDINNDVIQRLIPVMVYLVLLGFFGLIGNVCVLAFYSCKAKLSASTTFIQTLCIADLAVCCLSVPIDIADIIFYFTFVSAAACKILRFINHVSTFTSCLTLGAIAAQRHRMICTPFKKQFSTKQSRVYCVVISAAAAVIACPVFAIYTNVTVDVPNNFYKHLEGKACTSDQRGILRWIMFSFSLFQLLAGFVIFLALTILYMKIGCVVYKHRKKISPAKEQHSCTSAEHTETTEISMSIIPKEKKIEHTRFEDGTVDNVYPQKTSDKEAMVRPSTRYGTNKLGANDHHEEHHHHHPHLDKETVKFTALMLTITAIFFLSFVPYIAVLFCKFVGTPFGEVANGLLWYNLLVRSYFLNSAVNPIIYGLFNSEFRHFVRKIFLHCTCD